VREYVGVQLNELRRAEIKEVGRMSSKRTSKRKCDDCVFFEPSSRLCLRLGITVNNPSEPPCLKITNSVMSSPSIPTTLPAPPSPRARLENIPSPPPVMERPKMAEENLAPTGIEGLDRILGGGFIKGKTYLIAGETGTGKTIFSLQFLITGAKLGEPGVYLAIDEPANHVITGIKRFGWDVDPFIKKKLLLFLDMRGHFAKVYMKGERIKIEPKHVAEGILEYVEKIDAKRLVIDPIAPLMYSHQDVLWAREYLRELIFALEKRGDITTIMTSEIPTGTSNLSRFGVEEFLATGIIVLGIEEIRGRVVRTMFIRKMRWCPVQPSKYIFRIERGKGIILEGPIETYL